MCDPDLAKFADVKSFREFVAKLETVDEYEALMKQWRDATGLGGDSGVTVELAKRGDIACAPLWYQLMFHDAKQVRYLIRAKGRTKGLLTELLQDVSIFHTWLPIFVAFGVLGVWTPFVWPVIDQEFYPVLKTFAYGFEGPSTIAKALRWVMVVATIVAMTSIALLFARRAAGGRPGLAPDLIPDIPSMLAKKAPVADVKPASEISDKVLNRIEAQRKEHEDRGFFVSKIFPVLTFYVGSALYFAAGLFLSLRFDKASGLEQTRWVLIETVVFIAIIFIPILVYYDIRKRISKPQIIAETRAKLSALHNGVHGDIKTLLERSRAFRPGVASLALIKQRLLSRLYWEQLRETELAYDLLTDDVVNNGFGDSWRLLRRLTYLFIAVILTALAVESSQSFQRPEWVAPLVYALFFAFVVMWIATLIGVVYTKEWLRLAKLAVSHDPADRVKSYNDANVRGGFAFPQDSWPARWEYDDVYEFGKWLDDEIKRMEKIQIKSK